MINIKGTKKLYIVKTCEQILYFNSISTTFSFNTTAEGGDWGWALPPKNQFRFTPQCASCLAKFWPNYVIFTILFQSWSKVLSPVSNLADLALQSQNMMSAVTQENAFGLCVVKVYSLTGESLNAYSLYTVHISLHISLFQIRKYSYVHSLW